MSSTPSSHPPSLAALRERTRLFREHNDRLEQAQDERATSRRKPLEAAELAPAIRQANEEHVARMASDPSSALRLGPRDLESYVPEFDRTVAYLRECIIKRTLDQGDVDLLHASLTEYRSACDAEPGTAKRRAVIAAMFAAVNRIDPTKR